MLVCVPTAMAQESLLMEETQCWHGASYKIVAVLNEWMREDIMCCYQIPVDAEHGFCELHIQRTVHRDIFP